MAKLLTGRCPSCRSVVEFSSNDSLVTCFGCDETFTTNQLIDSGAPASAAGVAAAPVVAGGVSISMAGMIDSPDSGLVYLENCFANYDWDQYCEGTGVLIPEIEEMVEKSKIKHGATADAWLLDFESVATPLTKKINGLHALAEKMAASYSEADNADIYASFDHYKEVVDAVVLNREALVKRMTNAVAYAERFALAADKLAKMKADLAATQALLDGVKKIDDLYDVPEIEEAQKAINKKKVQEFSAKGIDAVANYKNAVAMFDGNAYDRGETVKLFESVRGYEKSVKYINALNRYFSFNGEFYNFFGRNFIFRAETKEPSVFDPAALTNKNDKKAAEKAEKQEKKANKHKSEHEKMHDKAAKSYAGTVLSLYEIEDGEPAETPILTDITQILTVYGNDLYFIKLDSSICAFNINTRVEKELDIAEDLGDYIIKGIYFNSTRTSFFVRKKLDLQIEKAGCFKKLLGKKDVAVERKNNYAIVEIDMANHTTRKVVDSLIDVTEFYGDNIFYTVADEDPESTKITFTVTNVRTLETRAILNDECEIHTVVDDKVVYSRYAPNAYNKDLFVYDIESGTDTLIESNVLDYFRVINSKVYYTVGNDDYAPLFANNLEGTDRVEIMKNVENVISERAGWMYVIRGWGRNAALLKVSSDGKRRILICTQFKKDVKVTENYIYYVDSSDSLRVVRTDGKNNTLIATDIDLNNVIVDNDCIFYLRREQVSDSKYAYSLYRMDMDGHNVRKLVFNVTKIQNYDENTLYIKKSANTRFQVTIPALSKKEPERTEDIYRDIDRYFKYDKKSGKLETILTIGLPHSDKYMTKGGCMKKPTEVESTIKEMPEIAAYKRKGIAKVGAVYNAQTSDNDSVESSYIDSNGTVQQSSNNGGLLGKIKLPKINIPFLKK